MSSGRCDARIRAAASMICSSSVVGVSAIHFQSTVYGFTSTANLLLPATTAVLYPARFASSKIVGDVGYTGPDSGRSPYHMIACASGTTPVSMLTSDGTVID